MRVTNNNGNNMDLFTVLTNSLEKTGTSGNDFITLLRKISASTDDAAISMGKTGKGKTDRSQTSSVSQQYGDEIVAMTQAAQPVVQQPVQDNNPAPASEAEVAVTLEQVTTVEQQAQAAAVMEMAVEIPLAETPVLEQQGAVVVNVTPQAEEAGQVAVDVPQTQQNGESQDKFGAMLDQAQQELQSISVSQQEVPVEEVVEEIGLPQPEDDIPVEDAPADQGEPIVGDEAVAETEEQSGAGQQQNSPQSGKQPNTNTMEQQPMSKMPEQDKAVLGMKDQKSETERETSQQVAPADQRPEPSQPEPVREAPQPEPQRQVAQETDQADQIHTETIRQLELGKTEFRMQLMPEELGKVDVRMMLEGNRLAVEILAATPKAAELLNRQAESLAQSLRLQEFDVQSIQVITESQTASGYMESAFNMLNGQTQESWEQGGAARAAGGSGIQGEGAGETAAQERVIAPETLMDYDI